MMSSILHQFIPADGLMQSAINAFAEWRATRKKIEPIPAHLWLLVEPLIKHYSFGQITKNLGLSTVQLKNQLSKSPSQLEESMPELIECTQQFSMLPVSNNKISECCIEFNCKHASAVKLSGLSISELKQVVSLLISEMPCYN